MVEVLAGRRRKALGTSRFPLSAAQERSPVDVAGPGALDESARPRGPHLGDLLLDPVGKQDHGVSMVGEVDANPISQRPAATRTPPPRTSRVPRSSIENPCGALRRTAGASSRPEGSRSRFETMAQKIPPTMARPAATIPNVSPLRNIETSPGISGTSASRRFRRNAPHPGCTNLSNGATPLTSRAQDPRCRNHSETTTVRELFMIKIGRAFHAAAVTVSTLLPSSLACPGHRTHQPGQR